MPKKGSKDTKKQEEPSFSFDDKPYEIQDIGNILENPSQPQSVAQNIVSPPSQSRGQDRQNSTVGESVLSSEFYQGRILSPEQENKARDYFKQNEKAVKFSHKQSGMPFSVLKTERGMFAMYYGKEKAIGKGNFGAVKLAQNIDTGEWVCVKIQQKKREQEKKPFFDEIEKEHHFQDKVGQLKGTQQRLMDTETPKVYSVMKLIRAKELNKRIDEILSRHVDLLDEKYKNSPEEWKKAMIDFVSFQAKASSTLAKEVADLHQKDIIHRDLHTGNVLLSNTGESYIIDFGKAAELDPKTKTVALRRDGAIRLFSPQVQAVGRGGIHAYTTKDDIWGVQECFNAIKLEQSITYFGDDVGIPRNEQKEILKALTCMRHTPVDERPDADKLNQILKRAENYLHIAQGIDLRADKSDQEKIDAYKKNIAEYGKNNNYSTVNVTTDSGHHHGLKALVLLNMPISLNEMSQSLVGMPKVIDQDTLEKYPRDIDSTPASNIEEESKKLKKSQAEYTELKSALHEAIARMKNSLHEKEAFLIRPNVTLGESHKIDQAKEDIKRIKWQLAPIEQKKIKEVEQKLQETNDRITQYDMENSMINKVFVHAQKDINYRAPWILKHREQDQIKLREENSSFYLVSQEKNEIEEKINKIVAEMNTGVTSGKRVAELQKNGADLANIDKKIQKILHHSEISNMKKDLNLNKEKSTPKQKNVIFSDISPLYKNFCAAKTQEKKGMDKSPEKTLEASRRISKPK